MATKKRRPCGGRGRYKSGKCGPKRTKTGKVRKGRCKCKFGHYKNSCKCKKGRGRKRSKK